MNFRNPYSEFKKQTNQSITNKTDMYTKAFHPVKLLKYKDKGITLNVARIKRNKILKKETYGLLQISFSLLGQTRKQITSLKFYSTERSVGEGSKKTKKNIWLEFYNKKNC